MHETTRFLLIEDNPGDARLIREMLADARMPGAELSVEGTLDSGLREAATGGYAAVLLDLSLPDSQGIDTFRRARAALPSTPVIVLSGNQDEDMALVAVREGAQDYLVKGAVEGPTLARSLRYAIERNRSQEALEKSESELRAYRAHLEEIVEERTADLRRVNRELEEASRAKSEFLAGMSHELRTPLNSILGFSGIMLQGLSGDVTEEQRTQLEMIQRSGRRLLGLVNDVLDLSRIEAGGATPECRDLDVAPMVAACVETVTPLAVAKGLPLRVALPEVPISMRGDAAKMQQVLINLLANAVKFTDDGWVGIDVRLSDPDTVTFTVSDTGRGMTEEEISTIFGDFVQIPSEGAKPEGTGLGLAISRRLAAIMGGGLAATSQPGLGSSFTFSVPRTCQGARTPEPGSRSPG